MQNQNHSVRKTLFVKGHPYGKRFQKTHGLSKHPLFRTWCHMIERCHSAALHKNHRYYKSKGIEVCEAWKNDFLAFYNWSMENGWQQGLTIDRRNPDGNYEPVNCEYISRSENSKRMRAFHRSDGIYNGKSIFTAKDLIDIKTKLENGVSCYEIAKEYGAHRTTIGNIKSGRSYRKEI